MSQSRRSCYLLWDLLRWMEVFCMFREVHVFITILCVASMWWKLTSYTYFQELEKQESEVRSNCDAKRSALEDAVCDLEERVAKGEIPEEDLDVLLVESLDHLTSAKKVLFFCYRQAIHLEMRLKFSKKVMVASPRFFVGACSNAKRNSVSEATDWWCSMPIWTPPVRSPSTTLY